MEIQQKTEMKTSNQTEKKEGQPFLKNVPLLMRYNQDAICGEDANEDTYDNVPVSKFGMTMLKNMGWQEGKTIGKNRYSKNVLTKPIQYVPHYGNAGLGSTPAPHLKQKREHLVAPIGPDGKIRHVINIDEKLVPQSQNQQQNMVQLHSEIQILKGKYQDMVGVITEINNETKETKIELSLNRKIIRANLNNLKLNKKSKKIQKENHYKNEYNKLEKKKRKHKRRKPLKWVKPQIKVRIISKNIYDGKHYEEKVVVDDILGISTFQVITKTGQLLEIHKERHVETVIPSIGKKVLIVRGEYKGKTAELVDRSKRKNKVWLKLDDDFSTIICSQDDCAEYVGAEYMGG